MGKLLNSKIVRTILIILTLILLSSWGLNKYLTLKTQLKISEQNVTALADTIRVTKNKVGTLEFSKELLVAKNKRDLKDLNLKMTKIVKEYQGEINELSVLVGQIKSDTIVIDNTKKIKLPDNTDAFTWTFSKVFDSDNSRFLSGVTKFKFDSIKNVIEPLGTTITRDEINFNIIQGIRTRSDGKVEMFASSNHPNFIATELNSVIIEPSTHPALDKFSNEKKLRLGFYTGFGATTNLSDYSVTAGPQIGVGLIYIVW